MKKSLIPNEPLSNGDLDPDQIRLPATEPDSAVDDSFDPENFRLTQDLSAATAVKKCLTTVPPRKPDKAAFVRVHPSDSYCMLAAIIEMDGAKKGELFLVAPHLVPSLSGENTLSARRLFTAIDRQGTIFLWPVKMPNPNGRQDNWSRSSLEAATAARTNWVRVRPNMDLGAYEINLASAALLEPEWPTESFADLLRIAFRDRTIRTLDDPILRQLRGEF